MKMWSEVTPLTFTETTGYADIEVSFVRYNLTHTKFNQTLLLQSATHLEPTGRMDTFLSQNTLAHAFYPHYGGNVHMNEEKRWTAGPYLLEVSLLFQFQTSLFSAIFVKYSAHHDIKSSYRT